MLDQWFQRSRVVMWIGTTIGILLLVFCVPALPKWSKIAGGDGIPGTYHVTGEFDCSGITSDCVARNGTFSSDDGKVIRKGVQARLSKPVRHGDLRPVYDIGDENEVFVKTNEGLRAGWPVAGSTLGVVLIGLGVQTMWYHGWFRRPRREGTRHQQEPGPSATSD